MKSEQPGNEVLRFWFEETTPEKRFGKDASFDQTIRDRFLNLHTQAKMGELDHWRETIHGRLAEIIILDQFSRNLFRESGEAFAQDAQSLALSQEALRHPQLQDLSPIQRAFLYMPFMHSESLKVHERAMKLFNEKGLEENYRFEILHKEIIEKFGRYPHRNEVLGRASTAEEKEYLRTTKVKF